MNGQNEKQKQKAVQEVKLVNSAGSAKTAKFGPGAFEALSGRIQEIESEYYSLRNKKKRQALAVQLVARHRGLPIDQGGHHDESA